MNCVARLELTDEPMEKVMLHLFFYDTVKNIGIVASTFFGEVKKVKSYILKPLFFLFLNVIFCKRTTFFLWSERRLERCQSTDN